MPAAGAAPRERQPRWQMKAVLVQLKIVGGSKQLHSSQLYLRTTTKQMGMPQGNVSYRHISKHTPRADDSHVTHALTDEYCRQTICS
jgi:hypothetical protein